MKCNSLLEFNQAYVVIGGNRVLNNVSFEIGLGENVAIIGPNGSGKTTLIRTITRDCYPTLRDDGVAVKILGEHTWNLFLLRTIMGVVTCEPPLGTERDISGREMVVSSFLGSVGVFPFHTVTEDMEIRAIEVLDFLEAAHLSDKLVTAMSTGELRRVMIARALVHEPKALVLDEPFNGLDPHAARKFSETLRKVAISGKSIIMVTHHLQDIIPEINLVIMLSNGQIFADGPKEELLTEANLSELFNMPVEISRRDGYYHLWT